MDSQQRQRNEVCYPTLEHVLSTSMCGNVSRRQNCISFAAPGSSWETSQQPDNLMQPHNHQPPSVTPQQPTTPVQDKLRDAVNN